MIPDRANFGAKTQIRTSRKSVRAFVRGSIGEPVRDENAQIPEQKRKNGQFVRLSADSPRPSPRTLSRVSLRYPGVRAGCPPAVDNDGSTRRAREYDTLLVKLGARLELTREMEGLTVDEMAARAGVSRPTMTYLLKAQRDPRLSTVAAVASALNCRLVLTIVPHSHHATRGHVGVTAGQERHA